MLNNISHQHIQQLKSFFSALLLQIIILMLVKTLQESRLCKLMRAKRLARRNLDQDRRVGDVFTHPLILVFLRNRFELFRALAMEIDQERRGDEPR